MISLPMGSHAVSLTPGAAAGTEHLALSVEAASAGCEATGCHLPGGAPHADPY